MREILSRFVILFLLIGCCPFLMGQTSGQVSAPEYSFAIVRVFPHDTSAYTQGLAYHDGFLYEGTGRNGQSSLRKVRLETGEVIQRVDLGSEFFGEGITIVKDRVVQLTWKSGVGFVYDQKSFHLLRKTAYSGEGWGLATDGHELFLSDGTSQTGARIPRASQVPTSARAKDGRFFRILEMGDVFTAVSSSALVNCPCAAKNVPLR